ncbi:MAG: methylenetetrahydrofolate reductase [NAD(P)H] [Flavobacteriaceae bacterium]
MKVTQHIEAAKGKTLFSFELLPPNKGQTIDSIYAAIDPLMEFNPPFIEVTYHREDFEYVERPDGLLEKRITRKRPGTLGITSAIQHKYQVDAIPHILCGGFTRQETEDLLIDLNFIGIDNLVALRGDAMESETYFKPEKDGHAYASDLVGQIADLNNGKYLDASLENSAAADFCIGVAGYPEKHMEAPSLDHDLKMLKAKVDAGAHYIVTQMFFDNQKFFEFVEKCKAMGINVPIIPGLKPISTKRQLNLLPHSFHVDLPADLVNAVEGCKDNAAVYQVGIEWCIQQSKELMQAGVPILHYYTMSRPANIKAVAEAVF